METTANGSLTPGVDLPPPSVEVVATTPAAVETPVNNPLKEQVANKTREMMEALKRLNDPSAPILTLTEKIAVLNKPVETKKPGILSRGTETSYLLVSADTYYPGLFKVKPDSKSADAFASTLENGNVDLRIDEWNNKGRSGLQLEIGNGGFAVPIERLPDGPEGEAFFMQALQKSQEASQAPLTRTIGQVDNLLGRLKNPQPPTPTGTTLPSAQA